MTPSCFSDQLQRLKVRFGDKAFDDEFTLIIQAETKTMLDDEFIKLVNFLIGSRQPNRPPLLVDFTEGRINAEKRRLEVLTTQAAQGFNAPRKPLKQILERNGYHGCESISEAVEVERIKLRIEAANKGAS